MESAFAWIGQIVEWFGQFIPRLEILDTTQGAVKFVRGKHAKPLGPGLHFYWPLITKFQIYPLARQADDLRTQTIVTTDDKTIAVGGMIVYEVTDILPLLAQTYMPSQTVKDLALSVIHDVCCQFDWVTIKDMQRTGKLDTRLRQEARKALEPYGVRIVKMMLTDLAPCRVLKVIQSTSKDAE